jgi:hypothetical protein
VAVGEYFWMVIRRVFLRIILQNLSRVFMLYKQRTSHKAVLLN